MADRNNTNGIPNGMPNPWAQMMDAAAINFQNHPFFAAFNPEARDRGNDDARTAPPDYEDPPASVPDGDAPPQPPPPPGHGPPPHHRGHHGPHHGPRHGPHHGPHHGPPPHDADPFHGHGFGFGGPHPYASFGPFDQAYNNPFFGGPCGARGGFGGRGGHGGPSRGGPRGGWGGRGRGHCRGRSGSNSDNQTGENPFAKWQEMMKEVDVDKVGEFFAQMAAPFYPDHPYNKDRSGPVPEGKDFQPAADIFDTESAYVVHLSLPGAKKEDVGVNWDADKFELSVAGVVYRPGDEEMLKTLSLDERQVGAFERKIALGTKENPVHIDAEGISAKMEDGVLMITAPKMEQDFVEVKKVEIE